MKRFAITILLAAMAFAAEEKHAAKGIVLKTDAERHSLVVSCEEIPGYMAAMAMEFTVRDPASLSRLKPGARVDFSMVARGQKFYAEEIHEGTTANFESEPMAAGQLTALNNVLAPDKTLVIGEPVPDFALTDQARNVIHLAHFQGKVVAFTFGYSRCPNPNYCFRLSSNLQKVEQRFHDSAGRDLILLTIMIDPEHDQGATLSEYAAVFKADPANWHFLTGPLPQIEALAALFGVNFWRVDGRLTHSLHTVILDRQGKLAANLEGNRFTAQQLGDLVQSVMDRP